MDNIRYVRESELNNKNEIFSNLNSRHVVLMNKITDFYSNKNNFRLTLARMVTGLKGTIFVDS